MYGDGEEKNEERKKTHQTQYILEEVAMIVRCNERPQDVGNARSEHSSRKDISFRV